jgi:hypothetical protein
MYTHGLPSTAVSALSQTNPYLCVGLIPRTTFAQRFNPQTGVLVRPVYPSGFGLAQLVHIPVLAQVHTHISIEHAQERLDSYIADVKHWCQAHNLDTKPVDLIRVEPSQFQTGILQTPFVPSELITTHFSQAHWLTHAQQTIHQLGGLYAVLSATPQGFVSQRSTQALEYLLRGQVALYDIEVEYYNLPKIPESFAQFPKQKLAYIYTKWCQKKRN